MQIDPRVAMIVKAIALTENGGKIPDTPVAGQSGEMKSIFQYTPGTWKGYAKEILGQDVPMTKESESAVTYGKVHKWLQQGYEPEEIASIWNSGKPDAYKQGFKGTNKYGVKYDVPAYVEKFKKYLGSSEGQPPQQQQPQQQSAQPLPTPQAQPKPQVNPAQQGLLPNLMNQARQARQAPAAKMPGQKM